MTEEEQGKEEKPKKPEWVKVRYEDWLEIVVNKEIKKREKEALEKQQKQQEEEQEQEEPEENGERIRLM